jgi:O-antigen/teichoic acid export membrane protein
LLGLRIDGADPAAQGFALALTESDKASGLPGRLSPAALIARGRSWLSDDSHHSIAQKMAGAAFLIRVLSAALIYGSQILLARWMGTYEFGIYVYVWTLVILIGDLSDLGLASAAQRFVPEYNKRGAMDLLRGFVLYSRWMALGSATAMAVLSALAVKALEPWLASYVVLPVLIACVTLPFYVLMQVQDGIARSYNWVQLALLPLYVVRHVVMLLLILAAWLWQFPADAVTAVIAVGIAIAVTAVGQTVALNRRLRREIAAGPKSADMKVWYATALPILMVEGLYLWLTHTDILVLQYFRSPEDVAVYFAAAKTLTLVSFVYFAVAGAVAHRFSEYHVGGDRQALASFLHNAVKLTFWPSLAAAIVILLAGKPLLMLFGANFVEGYPLIFIMTAGLLARASVGPAERLLLMVGQQRLCAAIYAIAFALNLGLCLFLVPRYGMQGAAASVATALVVESILLFVMIRRRLGLHAFVLGRPKPA